MNPPIPEPEGLMKMPAVLARLNVCRSTLYKLRKSGDLPEIRVGGRSLRFDPADVARYENAQRESRRAEQLETPTRRRRRRRA